MNYKNTDEEGEFRPPYVDPLSGVTATSAPQAPVVTDPLADSSLEMGYNPAVEAMDEDIDDVIHAAMGLLGPDAPSYEELAAASSEFDQIYGDASILPTLDDLELDAYVSDSASAPQEEETAPLVLNDADVDAHYDYDSLLDSIMTGADYAPEQDLGPVSSATGNLTNIVAEVQAWDNAHESAPAQAYDAAPAATEQAPPQMSSLSASAFVKEPSADGAAVSAQEPTQEEPQAPSSGLPRPEDLPSQIGSWTLQGTRTRVKPKIAAESRPKGLRGSLNLDKTTLNMAMQMKTISSPSRAFPIFFAALLCIAAFSWFGVMKPLEQVKKLELSIADMQSQRDQLNQSLVDFTDVQKEHQMYGDSWMTEIEQAQVDALEVLAILERELLPAAHVNTASLDANLLSVTMSGVTLDATAAIVSQLEQVDLVKSVAVYTAVSMEDRESIVTEGGFLPENALKTPTPASGEALNTTVTMAIMLEKPAADAPTQTPVVPTEGENAGEEANPA